MKNKIIFVTIFSVLVVVALAFGAFGVLNEGITRVSGSTGQAGQIPPEEVMCAEGFRCLSSGGNVTATGMDSMTQGGAEQYALYACELAFDATMALVNSCLQEALAICNNSGPSCVYGSGFGGSPVQACQVTGCTSTGAPPQQWWSCTADGNVGTVVTTCTASSG